ncbi:bifunctional DNA-binding transcriptional regulator/O6-methylguanine-DNA methyltransferase Ada [Pseudomonas sp. C2L12B]|nr:bifunctional DNA-binding transcriptional regulator/O6-methylguanine-DNA methyltransferase Ada [Pseudomonas typographi]MBD1552422.1 bifunctional DNA-binding transcriptional regulator/O6-methylguanine-DNA methyltransferase Ada [Pseudomonas typographi]MBD1587183.1 bifunctional DNA-binding transcriptional regulator/O6-methylguanine-DNA methyltransferase Ada [Pseudomonas typographi]
MPPPTRRAQHARLVVEACRQIDRAEAPPRLDALAERAGLSPAHFHRLFKAHTGLTPKAYADAARARRARDGLADPSRSVTAAAYDAGFNAHSRFYASSQPRLGMPPKQFRQGGAGVHIRFALAACSLGTILVAESDKGICAILLGDEPERLLEQLQDSFPRAELIGADPGFEQRVAQVVGFVEAPRLGLALPLDIRGTAFQERVWQALRDIPPGETASYTQVAERIGQPGAVRAVAQACGANRLAVAVPCHRVVRHDGALAGYRWGVERKRALLGKENAVQPEPVSSAQPSNADAANSSRV